MKADPERVPTLREVQRWMAAQVLRGAGAPRAAMPRAAAFADLLVPPPNGSLSDRLQVYAGGYPARVHEAVAEAFPAVVHLIGEEAFAAFVHRYIAATPLSSYNLNDAGEAVPRFLRADPLAAQLPFLPDLARLEWQVMRAFHAAEQAALDPATLAAWSLEEWEHAVLRFQPALAVVTSQWPIREIWEARTTPVADIDIDVCNRPEQVLVYRARDSVQCTAVEEAQADCLRGLLDGEPLGRVTAEITARGGDPASVSAWFERWMALRLITGCELTPVV